MNHLGSLLADELPIKGSRKRSPVLGTLGVLGILEYALVDVIGDVVKVIYDKLLFGVPNLHYEFHFITCSTSVSEV
jgi:hypothetical protein